MESSVLWLGLLAGFGLCVTVAVWQARNQLHQGWPLVKLGANGQPGPGPVISRFAKPPVNSPLPNPCK